MSGEPAKSWREELRGALLSAFNESSLAMMLREKLDLDLNHIAGPGPLENRVFQLITHFKEWSRIPELVAKAREANPTNAQLRQYAQKYPSGMGSDPLFGGWKIPRPSCTLTISIGCLLLVGGFIAWPEAMKTPNPEITRNYDARAATRNNFQQVAIATTNYADAMGKLPGPFLDRDLTGRPIAVPAEQAERLSWRVAVLPYIEEDSLYRQFDLDQPWDSPTNRPQANVRVRPLSHPLDGETADTRVRTFYDGGAVFESDPAKRIGLEAIQDGTSNTILYVEASSAVTWTQFNDFKFDKAKSLPPLGHPKWASKGFHAAMADGSVRFITTSASPDDIKKAISRSGPKVDLAD